jgi:hypothetical protein
MNNKGYIITITTLYFVVIFLIFLGLVTFVVYKSVYTDKQVFQESLVYSSFNSSDSDVIIASDYFWCSRFFYYDANTSNSGYNFLDSKIYCEDYNGKRFI